MLTIDDKWHCIEQIQHLQSQFMQPSHRIYAELPWSAVLVKLLLGFFLCDMLSAVQQIHVS